VRPARAGLSWTAEDDGKLLLMAEAGLTIRTAAEQLERTTKSVRIRYCDLKGIARWDTRGLEPDLRLGALDVLRTGNPIRKEFEKLVLRTLGVQRWRSTMRHS
jgi:hypothetical protein